MHGLDHVLKRYFVIVSKKQMFRLKTPLRKIAYRLDHKHDKIIKFGLNYALKHPEANNLSSKFYFEIY